MAPRTAQGRQSTDRHLYSRAEDWLDPAPENFLRTPRREGDLLAYWEWLLYDKYAKASFDVEVGIRQNWNRATMERAKTFWGIISICDEIKKLCRTHPCRQLHQVIILLYYCADLFQRPDGKPDKKPHMPKITLFGMDQPGRNLNLNQEKADAEAQKVVNALETSLTLVARCPRSYLSSDKWTVLDGLFKELLRVARLHGISAPTPPRRSRGKPKGVGGDLSLYLVLLTDLLKECQQGRRHFNAALTILNHFYPPEFQKDYDESNIRSAVARFRMANQDSIARMQKWLNTNPGLIDMFPAPSFLA